MQETGLGIEEWYVEEYWAVVVCVILLPQNFTGGIE
jgi:hypothetical protein